MKGLWVKLFPQKNRAIITVEKVENNTVDITIPAWTRGKIIHIRWKSLPRKLRHVVKAGDFLIGKVNLAAEDIDHLGISDLEMAPTPDPNDGLA